MIAPLVTMLLVLAPAAPTPAAPRVDPDAAPTTARRPAAQPQPPRKDPDEELLKNLDLLQNQELLEQLELFDEGR